MLRVLFFCLLPASLLAAQTTAESTELGSARAEPEVALSQDWAGGRPWLEWEAATGDWGGHRRALAADGLYFAASYTFDWQAGVRGGVSHRDSFVSLLDFSFVWELEPLTGLSGLEFFADFNAMGGTPTQVGDLTGTSSIASPRRQQLSELWLQWSGGGTADDPDRLRVKLGKMDANSEFGFIESNGGFVNAGAAVFLTQLGLPTYPDPAVGALLEWRSASDIVLRGGFFDGSGLGGIETGKRGGSTFIEGSFGDSKYATFEVEGHWDPAENLGPGRLLAGVWYHSGRFDLWSGGTNRGTAGYYAALEQQLFRKNPGDPEDGRGLRAAIFTGYADPEVSAIEWHTGFSLVYTGLLECRGEDDLGLYVGLLDLSDEPGAGFAKDETFVELYYGAQISPFLNIKPHAQVIVNPSGDPTLDDALVLGLRVELLL